MENKRISPENKTNENKPAETDSAEIVRRHLEDENHQITDEEIRNVRVGTKDDEPVTIGAEAEARFAEDDSKEDAEDEDLDAPDPKDKPVTPWDVIK